MSHSPTRSSTPAPIFCTQQWLPRFNDGHDRLYEAECKDQCAKDRRIKSETTMPTHGLMRVLAARLDEMAQSGFLKGRESVICGVVPGRDVYGPRYLIEGEGDTPFLRMNSNSYLGIALRSEIIEAEERDRKSVV